MIQKAAAACVLLLAILPACVFTGPNRAATHDVEKPLTDPPQPESKYTTVEFGPDGLSELLYQTPPDRAFLLKEIRSTISADLVADVGGNLITVCGAWMFTNDYGPTAGGLCIRLAAGAKVPAGAALKLRLTKDWKPGSVVSAQVFMSGDLVRVN
ncbi:MAG: hypothetical protein HY286_02285 [Planctomycetes bacterium]|nr:hypothetical protein [Planctomycetota bacterium]